MWEKVKSDIKYEDKPMKGERLKWAQNSIFLYSAWCAPPKKKNTEKIDSEVAENVTDLISYWQHNDT